MRTWAFAALLFGGCTLVAGNNRAVEDCANGVDDDFDGRPDCSDRDCYESSAACVPLDQDITPLLSSACRDGWVTSLAGSVPHCEPWGPEAYIDCGEGRFDGVRCGPTGTGDSCDRPSSGTAIYVQVGGSGGDGSEDAPFGTLAEALALAPELIVFEGVEMEPVELTTGVRIIGVCSSGAVLAGGATLSGTGARLENVTIGGSHVGAALDITGNGARVEGSVVLGDVRSEAVATLDGVLLEGSLEAVSGEMLVDRSELRGAFEVPCIAASEIASVRVVDSTLAGCPEGAVVASEQAIVELDHVIADELTGPGLVASCDSPCLTVEASLVRRAADNTTPAIQAQSGGMRLVSTYVTGGGGILAEVTNGDLDLLDSAIDGNPVSAAVDAGLRVDGGRVLGRDVVVTGGSVAIDLAAGELRVGGLGLGGGTRPREQIGGLRAATGTTVAFTGPFHIALTDPCALRFEEGVSFSSVGGSIRDVVTAICAPEGAYDENALAAELTIQESTAMFRPL